MEGRRSIVVHSIDELFFKADKVRDNAEMALARCEVEGRTSIVGHNIDELVFHPNEVRDNAEVASE